MKKKTGLTHILFSIYCILLIWIILFKLSFSFEEIKMMLGYRGLNLIPFYYENEVSMHFSEVMRNFLIFIPFGVYLGMLGARFPRAVLTGFVFSLTMELCQLAFAMGASDITDIITNTLGTAIGAALYLLLTLIFKNKIKLNKALNIIALIVTILFTGFIFLVLVMSH